MKKSKSLPFIVASLLLCMPLSACNLGIGDNGTDSSSSSSETTSSFSSSEGGSVPNPTTEVEADVFFGASFDAEKTNPGYQSADVTLYYYNGTENNITAKFYKDAEETEDWEMVDEDTLVGDAYNLAGDLIEVHATFMQTYSTNMHESKYYLDNTGFKYVGVYNTEYQGTTYKQEMTFIFNQYGYCVYCKQTNSSGLNTQDTVRFTAKYSTDPIQGGGHEQITDEVTYEQFIQAARQAEKKENNYRSAKVHYVIKNSPNVSQNVDLNAVYKANISTGEWSYASGDNSTTYSMMISLYLEMKMSSLTFNETIIEEYNAKFYMNENGFRITETTTNNGETYNSEMLFDTFGFLTHLSSTSTTPNGMVHTFDAIYSTKEVSGGGDEELPQGDLTAAQWEIYCNKIDKVNSGYLSATLEGAYIASGSDGSGDAKTITIIFSNETGARGAFSEYKTTGDSSIASPFKRIINFVPSSYLNNSKYSFSHRDNSFVAQMEDSGHTVILTFDENGYITQASDTSVNSQTGNRTSYSTRITYSTKPADSGGGEQPEGVMTEQQWKDYCTAAEKVNKNYKSATLNGTLTNNTGEPGVVNAGIAVQIVYSNNTTQKRGWSVHHYQGDANYISFFIEFISKAPTEFIDYTGTSVTFINDDDEYYTAQYVNPSYEGTMTFDEDGYIVETTARFDEGDGKYTIVSATMTYSTESLPGGGGGEDPNAMTYEEWVTYATKAEQKEPGYKAAYLSATRIVEKEKESIEAVYSSENGDRDEFTLHSYEGASTMLSAANEMMATTPTNILPPNMETFEGTFTFIGSEKVFKAVQELNGETITYVFDEYGMLTNLVHNAKTTSFNGSIKYSTEPVSTGGEGGGGEGGEDDEGYDQTARQLGTGEYMFVQGGDPTLGWTAKEELLMYSDTIYGVSTYSTDIADRLQADKDNIDFLYSAQVTLGTGEAGWDSPIVIGDYKYMIDGSLTIKAHAAFETNEGEYENIVWYPDARFANMENFTPDSLFMPEWREEKDAYGIDWTVCPAAYEPGIYAFIVFGYKNSDEGFAGGMALIKLDDYDDSPLGEPILAKGYDVLVEGRRVAALTINPGNLGEFMAGKITARVGQEVSIKDLVAGSNLTMQNLDSYSVGFKVEDGKLICTDSGTYDIYVTLGDSGITKIYIGLSR